MPLYQILKESMNMNGSIIPKFTSSHNIDMNIYLDIDGVLLANDNNLALGADEFVKYLVTNFDVYWLTTHCQGDASVPLKRFGHLFQHDVANLLKRIKPTTWDNAKTEAIDFTKPFLWFDDDLYDEEREELIRHKSLASWIEVDLAKNPNELNRLIEVLSKPKKQ